MPTANSTVFQVTATGHTDGTAVTQATLLVDTSVHTVASTDAATNAMLSKCETLTGLRPAGSGSGALTLTAGG